MLEVRAKFLVAANWNGQLLRSFLPANSPLLLNLSEEGGQAEGAKH